MKLASWNVNSLRVRLPQVLQWLQATSVDVLCLQEIKLTDDKFPLAEFAELGYEAVWFGQKTYNGVAIVSRFLISDVIRNNPLFQDESSRILTATIEGMRIVCTYVPNGQALDSPKYVYKLDWLAAFESFLAQESSCHVQLAVLGDYNIAPKDRDVHDPKAWAGQVLVSDAERNAFARLQALPLHDAFRLFEQEDGSFSWWDYRRLGFQLNKGLRIDHILLSDALTARCESCEIDRLPRKWEQPSDHAPVVVCLRD